MTDWSTLKKLIWLRIIKGGGSALRTVTGSLIHITDALALPAEALSVNVSPIQDLHGYDSPWPAGGGKNLFDRSLMSNAESGTKYIDLTLNPNTTYTASSNDPMTSGAADIFFLLPGESVSTGANGVYNNRPVTKTTGADGIARIGYRAYNGLPISTLIGFETQVELGSTATSFAPYSNICPISGRTSATVTRTGRNLLNVTAYGGAFYNVPVGTNLAQENGVVVTQTNDGFDIVITTEWTGKVFATGLLPSGTYNLHFRADSTNIRLGFYVTDSNYVVTQYLGSANQSSASDKQITITGNGRIAVSVTSIRNETISIHDFQVEVGSAFTAYEPYQGNTYTIQLGDTVYGGTLDVTGGKMVVDMAMVDLGSLSWSFANQSAGIYNATLPNGKGIVEPPYTNRQQGLVCSAYGASAAVSLNDTMTDKSWLRLGSAMCIRDTSYSDVASFKTAMSGVQCVYPLATPIEITLTPTQIDMLLGENNLWSDAGDSTLTYYADGNASTSEALGILLGGTYNNPGGADDVSDDEALGILLGGS